MPPVRARQTPVHDRRRELAAAVQRRRMQVMEQVAEANEEAIRAWDGPLFDRFLRFRHLLTTGLRLHGEEGLRLAPPQPGERALDVGCGFGDTTQRLAELVGPSGEAVGVDAAP